MGNSDSHAPVLRVTKVAPSSPASTAGLHEFTDLITGVLNVPAEFRLESDFYKLAIEKEGSEITLSVFNLLSGESRQVPLRLTRDWPGADFPLGFKGRFESFYWARNSACRVVSIRDEKLKSRILPGKDFLLGALQFSYNGLDELREKAKTEKSFDLVFVRVAGARGWEAEKSGSEQGDEAAKEKFCDERLKGWEIHLEHFDYVPSKGLGFEVATGVLHDLGRVFQAKEQAKREKELIQQKDVELAGLGMANVN